MDRDNNSVIKLENVSAVYKLPTEYINSFKEYIIRRITFKLSYRVLTALRHINLEIPSNEVLGIIGRNGAGKSTLLKIISRVLPPSEGNVTVHGRVAPLLSLGAGFNPELTGRENIFLNGAILGLREYEIKEQINNIIAFSDLAKFIDSPIRTYSSGMIARLGFAVATSLEPDILIIDEILSVGDEAFRKKSYKRIIDYKKKGVTIMLVSHSLDVIQKLCDRVMWLDKGSLVMIGNPKEVVNEYKSEFKQPNNQS